MLTEQACGQGITQIGQGDAEHSAASLAARYQPPDATQLPCVRHAYPQ